MYVRNFSTLISIAGSLCLLAAFLIGYSKTKTKTTYWGAICSAGFLLTQIFSWGLFFTGMSIGGGSFWAKIQSLLLRFIWTLSPLCLLGAGISLILFFTQYRAPQSKVEPAP
jgi:hypothetical protein